MTRVDHAFSCNRETLTEVTRVLARRKETTSTISTGSPQNPETGRGDSPGALNMSLNDLMVSTSGIRSQFEYINTRIKDIEIFLNTGHHDNVQRPGMISTKNRLRDSLEEVERFEKAINARITAVRISILIIRCLLG